jgi:translation initiation factor IF-3
MIMVLAPHRATKVAASDAKVASAEATKTAAAAAKATHREATSPRGNQGNGGTPAAMAQVVNAAAAADHGAGEG